MKCQTVCRQNVGRWWLIIHPMSVDFLPIGVVALLPMGNKEFRLSLTGISPTQQLTLDRQQMRRETL